MAQIWRLWENSKVQAGDDSKPLNLAHFGTPNGSNLAILRKFKGSGRGGLKTVKFSHFGAPNGSNLVILKNSMVQAGEDSKPLNLDFGTPNGSNLAILRKFKGSGRGGFKTVKFGPCIWNAWADEIMMKSWDSIDKSSPSSGLCLTVLPSLLNRLTDGVKLSIQRRGIYRRLQDLVHQSISTMVANSISN